MTGPAECEGEPRANGFWRLVGYFLKLGTLGFGGPVALAGFMQDLVEQRRWISEDEYPRSYRAPLRPSSRSRSGTAFTGTIRRVIVELADDQQIDPGKALTAEVGRQ
jgi:hypothetical protein